MMTIPHFTPDGCLPPIRPGADAISRDRSPYRSTIVEVAQRFARTEDRRTIFRGFLGLRAALRELGITSGCQWLDGSFVEDCEGRRSRAPSDIDVVSWLPFDSVVDRTTDEPLTKLLNTNPDIFLAKRSKVKYRVDHYPLELGQPFHAAGLKVVSYWYSMWSHRREDQRWKGFVQVELSEDDGAAAALLGTEEAPYAP